LHLAVHFTLSLASAAVNDHDVDDNECNDDSNDQTRVDAFVLNRSTTHYALFVQSLETHVGSVCETGANSVENTKGLNLSTVGLLVDDDRGIDVSAEFFPVADLVVNEVVRG